jgi:hypothetical protein
MRRTETHRAHRHPSPTEALAIIEAGRDIGVNRLVVTYAQFEVVNMTLQQMKKAASMVPSSNCVRWVGWWGRRRMLNGCDTGGA